jgi:hypothetical protein
MSRSMQYHSQPYHTNRTDARQFGMQGKDLSIRQNSQIWRETSVRDKQIDRLGETAAGEVEIDLVAVEMAAEAEDEVAQYLRELIGRVAVENLEQAS